MKKVFLIILFTNLSVFAQNSQEGYLENFKELYEELNENFTIKNGLSNNYEKEYGNQG